MDPFQVETISQKLIRDVYSDGAQIHMCAVAAVEIACWDIIGKACNQPIYNLWAAAAMKNCAPTQTAGTGARARPRVSLRKRSQLRRAATPH